MKLLEKSTYIMEASVTLPDGKEIRYVKGEKGVKKLFIAKDTGALVVVAEDETLNFLNYPVAISYTKEVE